MSDTNEVRVGGIWFCKIGEHSPLQRGADSPMRYAVAAEYKKLTGQEPAFIFSGWSGELTEPERAVVENRLPVREATPPADAALAEANALAAAWQREFGDLARAIGCLPSSFVGHNQHAINAAAALRARAVPDGFVLVPVEPTRRMLEDGADEVATWYDDGDLIRHERVARFTYSAMLAASKEARSDVMSDRSGVMFVHLAIDRDVIDEINAMLAASKEAK